ncbi:MAG: bifunctional riboflavin kinase/FAD synthetase [Chloroflexota bacterium]
MLLEDELAGLAPRSETILTIGVFDGVHLGHKHLLSKLVEQSKNDKLISCVITFKQHPQGLFNSQSAPPFLTNLTQKTKLLNDAGAQIIIALTFGLELAQTGARQFADLLQKYLKMRGLVLGPDFTLGRNKEGNVDFLRNLGNAMNFNLTVVPHLKIDGEIVSSTAIRDALLKGDIKKVNRMLGRHFSLEGRIITGSGRGTDLGFPTANLDIEAERALPSDGIYATWAYIDNKRYKSITNIGKRPTFGDNERIVEVYIIDFQDNLYRHQLKIDIIEKLRDEKKFTTAEALQCQIADDIKQAEALLSQLNSE